MTTRTRLFRSSDLLRRLSVAVVLAAGVVAPAAAQLAADDVPREMQGVEIVDRLDEQVPLDLRFTNAAGEPVTLREYFKSGRPVILTLNYYRCPQLCGLTLNAMVDSLKELEWSAGEEFSVVTLSFNHREGPDLADIKKRAYTSVYGRESAKARDGWAFLVGEEDQIKALADSVGFGYRYDPRTGEYAHKSVIIFLTPDGRVSKYFDPMDGGARDLRLALVSASEGSIGSPIDKFLLYTCYQYDPQRNSFTPSAWKIMRTGGLVTLMLLAGGIFLLARNGSRWERSGGDGADAAAAGEGDGGGAGDVAAAGDADTSASRTT